MFLLWHQVQIVLSGSQSVVRDNTYIRCQKLLLFRRLRPWEVITWHWFKRLWVVAVVIWNTLFNHEVFNSIIFYHRVSIMSLSSSLSKSEALTSCFCSWQAPYVLLQKCAHPQRDARRAREHVIWFLCCVWQQARRSSRTACEHLRLNLLLKLSRPCERPRLNFWSVFKNIMWVSKFEAWEYWIHYPRIVFKSTTKVDVVYFTFFTIKKNFISLSC